MQLLMSRRLSRRTDSRQVYGSPGKHNYKLHPHHKAWERLTLSLQLGFTDSPFPAGREKRRERNHCWRDLRGNTGEEKRDAVASFSFTPRLSKKWDQVLAGSCSSRKVPGNPLDLCTGQVMPPCQTCWRCPGPKSFLGCVTCSELPFRLFFSSSSALHSWNWEINISRTGQPVLDRVTQGVQHWSPWILGHCVKDQM